MIHLKKMADGIGRSRVYGGIHYRIACTEGMKQGRKVAQNINTTLKFKKDKNKSIAKKTGRSDGYWTARLKN